MNAATVVRDRIVFMIWFIELRLGEKNIFPRKLDHELRASARICPGDFFEASRAHFSRSVTLRKEVLHGLQWVKKGAAEVWLGWKGEEQRVERVRRSTQSRRPWEGCF